MTDLDKLCEELCKSKLIKQIAQAIKFGRLVLTFHEEELTEISPQPRKRLDKK